MNAPDDYAAWAQGLPQVPPDVVPPTHTRPTREVVARLLQGSRHPVSLTHHRMIEDVDGVPIGMQTRTSTAVMVSPSLADLGWTEAEWNDPNIDA